MMVDSNETNWHSIAKMIDCLNYCDTLTDSIHKIATDLHKCLSLDSICIYLTCHNPEIMELVVNIKAGKDLPKFVEVSPLSHLCCCNSEKQETESQTELILEKLAKTIFQKDQGVFYPLNSHGLYLGAVFVKRKNDFNQQDKEILKTFIENFAVLIYLECGVKHNIEAERIEKELLTAHNLKSRLLPVAPPKFKNTRLGLSSWSSLQIGGDFYDFIPIDENKIIIFLGTCVGQGLKATLEITELITILHKSLIKNQSLLAAMSGFCAELIISSKRSNLSSLSLVLIDKLKNQINLVNIGNNIIALSKEKNSFLDLSIQEPSPALSFLNNPLKEEALKFTKNSNLIIVSSGIRNLIKTNISLRSNNSVLRFLDKNLKNDPQVTLADNFFNILGLEFSQETITKDITCISIENCD